MKILAIETSCDETGICVLEQKNDAILLRGNALASQIELHAQYGGVFPAMAKRAHAEKFIPLLTQALDEALLLDVVDAPIAIDDNLLSFLQEKESALYESLLPFFMYYKRPDIDYIAVTVGPGLEPALWVGVNAARALATMWNIPVIAVNHMEGHVVTALFDTLVEQTDEKIFVQKNITYPLLALLVSGGHTELVLTEELGTYQKIGATRDDAVGEAFDKVARMLGLPYPGGPAISKLAAAFRASNLSQLFLLPRPMLHSGDYDFSFSGIKTAVLYAVRDWKKDHGDMTEADKQMMAAAFEDAVVEVLIKKTLKAAQEFHAQTIIVGGGVASNTYLREQLTKSLTPRKNLGIELLFPQTWLATDNAVMIGLAALAQIQNGEIKTSVPSELKADGNLSL